MALSRRLLWCALAVCLVFSLMPRSAPPAVHPPSLDSSRAQPRHIKASVFRERRQPSAVDRTFLLLALLRAASQGSR